MGNAIILCVDDDTSILNAIRILLSQQLGAGHLIEVAESGAEALELCEDLKLDGQELSVVISDFLMPGMRGDELLVQIHNISPNTSKILLTGQSDLEGVKRVINEANLYRFLEKPFDNTDFILTVRSALRTYNQDRTLEQQFAQLKQNNSELELLVAARTRELVEKNQELERLSITDRLTGLYNRLRLDQVLVEELARSKRYGTELTLLMLDIDHFKSVNDNFGHTVGDQVLIEVAHILAKHTREVDVVGRWGGEEFLIICRETPLAGGLLAAEHLRLAMCQHTFSHVGNKTSSIGVAAYRHDEGMMDLLQRADIALYRAKENGRNRVESNG